MPRLLDTLNGEGFRCPIILDDAGGIERVEFLADADIDADGAPHAYHPRDTGLDRLCNARDRSGKFVGVLTDSHGRPLIQGEDDPAPGYYISTTTLELRSAPKNTQRRYINAETVPFIVVPPVVVAKTRGIVMGCRAHMTHMRTGVVLEGVVADRGPTRKTGELSIAGARGLGINSSPISGGEDRPLIRYELWPGVPAVINGVTYELQRS